MRSLATLGGILVLIVLAIAWKISNEVEAGQEPDKNPGRITLGVQADDPSESEGETKRNSASLENNAASAGTQEPKTPAASKPAETPPSKPASPASPASQTPPSQPAPAVQPPVAPITPPAEDEVAGIRYTVKEGDTLYGILTRAYGKANQALIDSIAVASDLDDPSRLSPGMVLVLPQVPGFDAPKRP